MPAAYQLGYENSEAKKKKSVESPELRFSQQEKLVLSLVKPKQQRKTGKSKLRFFFLNVCCC